MIQKQFFILILLVGVSIISCRQNDEINSNNDNVVLKEKSLREIEQNSESTQAKSNSEDSPTDIAKNADSIKIISIDPKDPPIKKDETHWKNSN